jgi:hypothetical protein
MKNETFDSVLESEKLNKEIAEAKAEIKNTDTRSDIRKAKDELVEKLKINENLTGVVRGSSTARSFDLIIDNKPYLAYFIPETSSKDLPADNIVTFKVSDTTGNVRTFPDTISIYDTEGKRIGVINDKDF